MKHIVARRSPHRAAAPSNSQHFSQAPACHWYDNGGDRHVAAYLSERDISRFDPKAPPPKTPGFWAIVDANRAPEDAELADVLDRLGNPAATTLIRVQNQASGDFETWIKDRKNRRQIPHRFEQCGYVPVRNDAAADGLWRINDKRQVVYAKSSLTLRDQLAEARKLAGITVSDAAPEADHGAVEGAPAGASVAFLITKAMKQRLRSRGLSDEQISNLTPQEAHDILNGKADTVVIEADPIHPCAQCGANNGDVYRIRGPNQTEAPLRRLLLQTAMSREDPMSDHRCLDCDRVMTWAERRSQFGRAIRAGLPPDEAKALAMPEMHHAGAARPQPARPGAKACPSVSSVMSVVGWIQLFPLSRAR